MRKKFIIKMGISIRNKKVELNFRIKKPAKNFQVEVNNFFDFINLQ